MEIELLITIVLLIALTFLATVDMAFSQLSDVGLRRLITDAEERPADPTLALLNEIREDRPRFRFTLSAGIQIFLVAVTVLITSIFLHWFSGIRLIAAALVSGLIVAGIFRQFIPRLISVRNPEATFLKLLPIARPVYRLFALVSHPWHSSPDRLRRNDSPIDTEDDDEENLDDLQALIDVGEAEGILEEEEGELIHSIIEFGDTRVSEVMTPRTEIVALPLDSTVKQARDRIIESKFSRLPVYRDHIDNIEGVIYVRDLLQCWSQGNEDGAIDSLLRTSYEVPETKPVADLLEDMQKARVQLAIVIDEYGGVAGLVTVEDILEEIVGEIEDEDGGEEIVEIVEANDGYYQMPGSTEIGKIERLFGVEIEDDDFTTIAGLVTSELRRVPHPGEQFDIRGLDMEVVDADERRITKLRLRLKPPANDVS